MERGGNAMKTVASSAVDAAANAARAVAGGLNAATNAQESVSNAAVFAKARANEVAKVVDELRPDCSEAAGFPPKIGGCVDLQTITINTQGLAATTVDSESFQGSLETFITALIEGVGASARGKACEAVHDKHPLSQKLSYLIDTFPVVPENELLGVHQSLSFPVEMVKEVLTGPLLEMVIGDETSLDDLNSISIGISIDSNGDKNCFLALSAVTDGMAIPPPDTSAIVTTVTIGGLQAVGTENVVQASFGIRLAGIGGEVGGTSVYSCPDNEWKGLAFSIGVSLPGYGDWWSIGGSVGVANVLTVYSVTPDGDEAFDYSWSCPDGVQFEEDVVCFPPSATVMRSDGTSLPIDTLKEGDTIFATTPDGALTVDTVSLFSLVDRTTEATFLSLTTDANQTLVLTPEHHLPVGDTCCRTLKKAKHTSVGDTVWTVSNGAVVSQTIARVELTIEKGLHNPLLTRGGFPVVNGIVTSFNTLDVVVLDSYAVPFLVPLCKATGTCSLLRRLVATAECAFKTLSGAGICKTFKYIDGLELPGSAPIAHTTKAAPLAFSLHGCHSV